MRVYADPRVISLPALCFAALLAPVAACCEWDGPLQTSKAYFEAATANDVRICIGAGTDVNVRDYWGFTPLHWAARYSSSMAVINALLDAGADQNATNYADATPLHEAARNNGNATFVEALLQRRRTTRRP